jgi:branched-subunit amino acid aminotransferase/4-amino-4-deoxychorismate lyase
MAGFEGIKWATRQSCFRLKDKSFKVVANNDKVYAVSRSIHYGLFLTFEGIRFFCKKNSRGKLEIIFLNFEKNLQRFQNGIAFNLGQHQQQWVPEISEMVSMFLRFMRDEAMVEFLLEMAELQAQGYLRPFTVDEEQSIGVTFPNDPSIRAVVCRYDQYLGEPFSGVVVPHYVRACCANGTGCLKLGVNYVISLKAVDEAKKILPEAASALLLDDRPFDPVEKRKITEWDSSCCLFALRDGTVIKIPESPLILPSVTIQGIVAILKLHGVKVEERDMTYGELVERTKKNGMVVVCSVGTAGILNRAQKLVLVNEARKIIAEQRADVNHELYQKLGEARKYYWDIYKEKVEVPPGLTLNKYEL